jgi:hypothetical protein
MKTDAEMMADIVAKVGDAKAREMVAAAYNAEIISNRLGRLETQQSASKLMQGASNLLRLALERVYDVVTLGD